MPGEISEAERRFLQMFGFVPQTDADWETAAEKALKTQQKNELKRYGKADPGGTYGDSVPEQNYMKKKKKPSV